MRLNIFSFLFFSIICLSPCIAGVVYIVPSRGLEKKPTDFDIGVFTKLKKALNTLGHECKFVSFHAIPKLSKKNLEYLILVDFSHIPDFSIFPETPKTTYSQHVANLLKRFDKNKLVLMCFEPEAYDAENHNPEIHKLFGKVITCYDKFKGQKYHKFYYPVFVGDFSSPIILFKDRKLATLINGCKKSSHPNELYSQRLEIIKFFENMRTGDFDFYGIGWDKKKYKNYKGKIDDKIKTLKKYKFCYCFENTKNVTGYISEKILDCFSAGCVPIYWGATNIDWYIPKNCYILFNDFSSKQEAYNFIKEMPEHQCHEYLNNIKKYLSSDAVLLFSWENFVDSVLEALFPRYGRSKVFNEKELSNLKKVDQWSSLNLTENRMRH